MTKLNPYVVLGSGIALLSATIALTSAGPALAQSMKPLLVIVGNTAQEPVPVRDANAPANEQFQQEFCFPPSSSYCQNQGAGNGMTVPATTSTGRSVRRLVLEYASGTCFNGLEFMEVQLLTSAAGGPLVRHHLVPVPGSPGWTNIAQTTRLYADPGSQVRFSGTTNGLGACGLALSGHFVLD
jgi:hypothetical protein